MKRNLIYLWLVLGVVLINVDLNAQDSTLVEEDSSATEDSVPDIQVGEIELIEITIEAVIEKPRVSIFPKRVEPELGEVEFIDRSFEAELKKGPAQPFLLKPKATIPFKIEKKDLEQIKQQNN